MKIYISILSFLFSFGLTAQTTNIPDQVFEQHLIDEGIDSDGVINGQVLTNDISGVESLDLSWKNLTDLTGIEAFQSLKILDISYSYLDYYSTPLDLSALISLEELYMDADKDDISLFVGRLLLNNNPNLQMIESTGNWSLNSIDLTGSDLTLTNLEISVYRDPTETGDLCIQVTNPSQAVAGQGNYTNWVVCCFYSFSDDCNLDIDDSKKVMVSLYPNPVENTFQITTSEEIRSVSVFSVAGREVANFNSQQDYDISQLSTGMYFVKIQSTKGEKVQRIVKR
ncbi:T9SS type A sorting domain-containing protein [Mesonia sp. MT50]|uniref:T9SS type A sorting domain-containing protein n=1 Tax=Mesonia profundi TaxID=3070998 RepID=A0ABU1A404_9FLAO|nr:T9SS type A sorting domain-containing protein [Mesonia profundi]MDQ7917589.1 T9SS type A sorting domain-containing protein [Mesonia profundi]